MNIREDILSDMLIHYSRDINQLCDTNRAVNRQSLSTLIKLFADKENNPNEKLFLFENHIIKNFLGVIDSPSDSVRETAIIFLGKLLELYKANGSVPNLEIQTLLIEKLFTRVHKIPYMENIEEIRLEIIKIAIILCDIFEQGIRKSMKIVQESVDSLLKDKYPEVKKICCVFIDKLTIKFPAEFSLNIKDILFSLVINCQHAHYKVRKESSSIVYKLLTLPNAAVYLEDIFPCLYLLQDDKHADVSLNSFECIGKCLMLFEFTYIKQFEDKMILFLLTGLLREKTKNISQFYLTEFGKRRKKLKEKFGV